MANTPKIPLTNEDIDSLAQAIHDDLSTNSNNRAALQSWMNAMARNGKADAANQAFLEIRDTLDTAASPQKEEFAMKSIDYGGETLRKCTSKNGWYVEEYEMDEPLEESQCPQFDSLEAAKKYVENNLEELARDIDILDKSTTYEERVAMGLEEDWDEYYNPFKDRD